MTMKPTGNVHRLPEIDSWRRQPQVKNALLHQIKNTTHEIHTIQKEMHGKLAEPNTASRLPKVFEDEAARGVGPLDHRQEGAVGGVDALLLVLPHRVLRIAAGELRAFEHLPVLELHPVDHAHFISVLHVSADSR